MPTKTPALRQRSHLRQIDELRHPGGPACWAASSFSGLITEPAEVEQACAYAAA